jgi:hypothetical protein
LKYEVQNNVFVVEKLKEVQKTIILEICRNHDDIVTRSQGEDSVMPGFKSGHCCNIGEERS